MTRSPRGTPVRAHLVKRGESLWAIASANHTTTAELMRINGLTRRSVIRAGQTIRMPR